MERVAWKGHVVPGKLDQWKSSHDAIWPEMTEALNQAGIHNYTIWAIGNELFGCFECESAEYAANVQAQSDVVARWNDTMKGIFEMDVDPQTGKNIAPGLVFYHK